MPSRFRNNYNAMGLANVPSIEGVRRSESGEETRFGTVAIRYLRKSRKIFSDPYVRGRFMIIARHYRALAEAEERIGKQVGIKRRSGRNLH